MIICEIFVHLLVIVQKQYTQHLKAMQSTKYAAHSSHCLPSVLQVGILTSTSAKSTTMDCMEKICSGTNLLLNTNKFLLCHVGVRSGTVG